MAGFPNLRHARLFLMVAEGASVHATAHHAGLTQPAVTLCLAALERFYNVALFERRPVGLVATKYGTVLAKRVARCVAFLTGAVRKASRETDASSQRIEKLLRTLTISQLRALVAMDHYGGFGAAAEGLGLRVPSVHRAIGELEGALGAELVYREKRTARLNTLGHEIALLFNLGLEELRSAAAEIKESGGLLEGSITVGAVRTAAAGVLPAAIRRLSTQLPAARYIITPISSPRSSAKAKCGSSAAKTIRWPDAARSARVNWPATAGSAIRRAPASPSASAPCSSRKESRRPS